MRQIAEMVILCYLMICAVYDVKYKTLPVWLLAAGTAGALGFALIFECQSWYLWVPGAMAGMLFLMAGRITKEGIGYGDGWMIVNLGICCGVWKLCGLLFAAFAAAAVTAGIGMRWKKWKKEKKIPFAPFLLLGYIGVWRW